MNAKAALKQGWRLLLEPENPSKNTYVAFLSQNFLTCLFFLYFLSLWTLSLKVVPKINFYMAFVIQNFFTCLFLKYFLSFWT
jgi:hypothetical protein